MSFISKRNPNEWPSDGKNLVKEVEMGGKNPEDYRIYKPDPEKLAKEIVRVHKNDDGSFNMEDILEMFDKLVFHCKKDFLISVFDKLEELKLKIDKKDKKRLLEKCRKIKEEEEEIFQAGRLAVGEKDRAQSLRILKENTCGQTLINEKHPLGLIINTLWEKQYNFTFPSPRIKINEEDKEEIKRIVRKKLKKAKEDMEPTLWRELVATLRQMGWEGDIP